MSLSSVGLRLQARSYSHKDGHQERDAIKPPLPPPTPLPSYRKHSVTRATGPPGSLSQNSPTVQDITIEQQQEMTCQTIYRTMCCIIGIDVTDTQQTTTKQQGAKKIEQSAVNKHVTGKLWMGRSFGTALAGTDRQHLYGVQQIETCQRMQSITCRTFLRPTVMAARHALVGIGCFSSPLASRWRCQPQNRTPP